MVIKRACQWCTGNTSFPFAHWRSASTMTRDVNSEREIIDCPSDDVFEPRPLLSMCQVVHGPCSQWGQLLRARYASRSSVNYRSTWHGPSGIPSTFQLKLSPSFPASHLVSSQCSSVTWMRALKALSISVYVRAENLWSACKSRAWSAITS